jgi:hypothetical protein
MKVRTVISGLVLAAAGLVHAEDPVHFADPALKAAVEETLGVFDPSPTDLLGLTSLIAEGLYARGAGIADLTGLQFATNIIDISACNNQISNISPLAGLTSLESLNLHENFILDLRPLAGLIHLQHLDLHHNGLSDISPLAGLKALRRLYLRENDVSDLSPLARLTALQELTLNDDPVEDVTALAGLVNLQSLSLNDTRVADLSALLNLKRLAVLDLREAPLGDAAYCSDLWTIQGNNPGMNLMYTPNTTPPAGVSASDGTPPDRIRISWKAVCNGPLYTTYYRVYRSVSGGNAKTTLGPWQREAGYDDLTAAAGTVYTYWIRASTSSQGLDAGDFSQPDSGWRGFTFTVSCTAGGKITTPRPGSSTYGQSQVVEIAAEPTDPNLNRFSHWKGTAVEAGKVTDPHRADTTVLVDDSYEVTACFVSRLDTLYVDDNAPGDPGPNSPTISDPRENGTREHPFDSIQEAIDVAADGASVVVGPGTYREVLDLVGKRIRVARLEPLAPYPVIDAQGQGPVVRFEHGEPRDCVLEGLVITDGQAAAAAAISCIGSSPTVIDCLIVGNRATDLEGAVIRCEHSTPAFLRCTIADNQAGPNGGGLFLIHSPVTLTDCIVWANDPEAIRLQDVEAPVVTYCDVTGAWVGMGNIACDPLFSRRGRWVDPSDPNQPLPASDARAVWIEGDYHLESQAGRWDPQHQAWEPDQVTSPCIDSGDPSGPTGEESAPNGGRVDLGAYGGTAQASKSSVPVQTSTASRGLDARDLRSHP